MVIDTAKEIKRLVAYDVWSYYSSFGRKSGLTDDEKFRFKLGYCKIVIKYSILPLYPNDDILNICLKVINDYELNSTTKEAVRAAVHAFANCDWYDYEDNWKASEIPLTEYVYKYLNKVDNPQNMISI